MNFWNAPTKKANKKLWSRSPMKLKDLNWRQAKQRFPFLNPRGDSDKDKVINSKDCKPFDKKRQHWNIKETKERGSYVKWMTPRQYLKKTNTPLPNVIQSARFQKFHDYEKNKAEPIRRLGEMIKDQKTKVEIPFVDNYGGHEGRHRAYAAYLAGEKKIPVRSPPPKKWRSEKVIESFLTKRFPTSGEAYREEWRSKRMPSDFPQRQMDGETLQAWKDAMKEEGVDYEVEGQEPETEAEQLKQEIEAEVEARSQDYDYEDEDD